MAIKKSPYDTRVCQGYITKKLIQSLEEAGIKYEYGTIDKDVLTLLKEKDTSFVRCINGLYGNSGVPTFIHPIVMKTEEDNKVYVDIRPCTTSNVKEGNVAIKNKFEYEFNILYALLTYYWNTPNFKLLNNISFLPSALYAKWISENLTRRFGLDPQDQLTIGIISALFYTSCFNDDFNFDDETQKYRVAAQVGKACYVNVEEVIRVIDLIKSLNSLDDLVTSIKEVTGNVRLSDLNVGILLSVLTGTWFGGSNPKELVGVALEYPPAWILIAYSAYNDRSYKNSGIAKLATRDKQNDIDNFVNGLLKLVSEPNH